MRRFYPIGVFILALFGSCNIFNKDEKEPAYIVIPSVDLQSNYDVEGTDSHAISEVWVYANDKITGVYDLPAEIPVLEEGATDIRVFAGIKNNGISSTRIIYPFFASVDQTINLEPLVHDTITPVFQYEEDLDIFPIDFDQGSPFGPYGNSDVTLTTTTDPDLVFEGNGSGYGSLTTSQDLLLVKSSSTWNWDAGQTVFLEMNYSCNNSFSVGLIIHKGVQVIRQFALIVNPTTSATGTPNWKKLYVDLGFLIKSNANADFFEIYLECSQDVGNPSAELFFDNFKIVEFEE